ncbi:phage holin family protein [Mucilaginibacter lacusdianchii]|uniref:phage holin family protein n=1 Tax=Mucilaginibacter lacusdianchii TaxID=2684211 RepID=UPI00131E64B2|nr:phage holin family protein [Mucilaginibacter sp. JXJ CY 39]
MNLIITLLINAGVILLMSYILPTVIIRSYGTAILVALVVGLLNATVGIFLRFPLNVLTLGLLSAIVRILITAVMIKVADKLFKGFELKGFAPAIIIAVVTAAVDYALSGALHP